MPDTRTPAEELAIAEQCDARGDHDNAIDALARATQLGDIEATTRLGKRLITGVNSPLLPTQGAGFLIEAFNKGGAEAAARLAVLAAAGVYVQSNLAEALGLLTAAAERGWAAAQTQLLALSPDRELASLGQGSSPGGFAHPAGIERRQGCDHRRAIVELRTSRGFLDRLRGRNLRH